MAFQEKRQAIVLFIVAPIGLLGAFAFGLESTQDRNIPLAAVMAIVSLIAIALGVRQWRRP